MGRVSRRLHRAAWYNTPCRPTGRRWFAPRLKMSTSRCLVLCWLIRFQAKPLRAGIYRASMLGRVCGLVWSPVWMPVLVFFAGIFTVVFGLSNPPGWIASLKRFAPIRLHCWRACPIIRLDEADQSNCRSARELSPGEGECNWRHFLFWYFVNLW